MQLNLENGHKLSSGVLRSPSPGMPSPAINGLYESRTPESAMRNRYNDS